MSPPKLWEALGTAAPREMRDVLKLIVTTEQTTFSHYLLPDLDDSTADTTTPDTMRNGRVRAKRVKESWDVDEIVITSMKKDQ